VDLALTPRYNAMSPQGETIQAGGLCRLLARRDFFTKRGLHDIGTDPFERQDNLDARIDDLTRQLRDLHARRDASRASAPPSPDRAGRVASWLLIVLAIAGAVSLYGTSLLAPVEKTAIGFGAAVAGIAYGLFSGARHSRLSQTAFGLGLAAGYLATYGAFFLPRLTIFSRTGGALPVLLAALIAVLIAAHLRRSAIAATLAFAAVFLTPPITVWHGTLTTVGYALAISCAGAAAVLLLQAHRGWIAPTWMAFLGAYTTAALYLIQGGGALKLTPEQHLRLCLGYLAIVFLVIAVSALVTARTIRHPIWSTDLLAFANAIACYVLGRLAVGQFLTPGAVRAVDYAFVAVLAILAFLSAVLARRRERLTEAFLAAMLLVLCWAVGAQLSDAALWIAPAATGLVLAIVYARTGVVLLKVLNVGVLGVTFAASLWAINWKGNLAVEEYQVVSNWLVGGSVPAALALTAAVYARFVRPRDDSRGRRWLFEGAWLDLTHPHMALLNAAAATLILLALTIFRLGGDPILPYAVAAEAMVVVALGYVLGAPPIRMAGIALLIAAHAVYYFFHIVPQGFSPDAILIAYPIGLAAATFAGGMLWEGQIKRTLAMSRAAYEPLSSVPYLLGAYLIADLLARRLLDLYAPLAQSGLALLLLVVALLVGYGGFKSGALLALAAGSVTFVLRLHAGYGTLAPEQAGTLAVVFLATFASAERILFQGKTDPGVRSLLVLAGSALGIVAAHALVDKPYLTLSLFALALALSLLAAVLRESRYAWPAVTLFALALGRFILYDVHNLEMAATLWSIAAAVVTVLALVVAWLRRRRPMPPALPAPESDADGHPA
jgi:hypothetical protein